MSDSPKAAWLQKVHQYWRENSRGITTVRRILADVMAAQDDAFDAEGLLQDCRQQDGMISLSTVYRTVRQLVDAGLLIEVEGIGDKHFYARRENGGLGDSTLVCLDCQEVLPLQNPCLALREVEGVRQLGYTARRVSLRVEGNCDELAQKGTCSRRNGDSR